MRWRRLIVPLHRDVGYVLAGLTVVYAVSGVAVNHTADFNPSYAVQRVERQVGALPELPAPELGRLVLDRLEIAETPTASLRTAPHQLKVLLSDRTLTVALPDGAVLDETVRKRRLLYELNYLHLNRGKGSWTWLADAYAVGLALLAVTGIFIVPGRKGLGGRGRWLLVLGIAIPLVFALLAG